MNTIPKFAATPVYDIPMRILLRKGGTRFLAGLGIERGVLLDTDVSTLAKRNIDFASLNADGGIHHLEFQRSVC